MMGFLFAVIAGAAMSVQGVMNTRLQEQVGLWEANAFVQGTAFVLSLIVMWIFGKGDWKALLSAPKWNLLGSYSRNCTSNLCKALQHCAAVA